MKLTMIAATALLLAVSEAEITRSASSLATSSADIAAATTERVIGVASSGFWSALPQATQEISVEVGTKLVFKWNGGSDVLLVNNLDAWDGCDLTDSNSLCLAAEPSTIDTCDGGIELSLGADNLFKYEAVVKDEGVYYFTSSQTGFCASDKKVKVSVSGPTSTPSNCASFEKKLCKSKEAKKFLGCKWSNRLGQCSVKNANFEQPIPLECEGQCCELNKRACKGAGSAAKAWSKENDGANPKKACKYTKDKSMQNLTPDGKHFAQCMPKE